MKRTEFKLAVYVLSTLLLTGVPAAAAETNPPSQEVMIDTDAGHIHFDFIQKTPAVPYLRHKVASTDAESNTLELANGSKWSCSNPDMVKEWVEGDQIVIGQNQAFFSTNRYALINVRLGKAIPISLLREPRPDQSLYITKIDFANDIVTLSKDGQQWEVFSYDHGTLRKFSEHDRLLIGVNTSDCCHHELALHYILINTSTNQYVRATPLVNR